MIDKLENCLGDQKDNLILWLPVFLGLGAAVYFGLKFEPTMLLTASVWALSFTLVVIAFVLRHHPKARFAWFFFAFAFLLVATGFGLSKIKTEIIYTPLLLKETRPLMIEGDVRHTETLEGRKGSLIVLEDVTIENYLKEDTPKKLRLTSRIRSKVNPGDHVQILAKLTPPSMPVMPNAYDFRRHYFFDGVGAMGFVLKNPVVIKEAQFSQYGLFLERIRKSMGEHIKEVLPSRLSGIVTALVTGERAAIEDEDWEALRVSGLAHIISISGLHVVLIAAPIFFFLRLFLASIPRVALYYPIKKYAAIVALIGCTLYVALVVPTVPTYRALLMTGIGLIAIMMDRSPFSLRLISFAAIVVLVIAPESIWSASFQLSFAAVLSLIISAESTREYWSKWRNNAGRTRKFLLYLGGDEALREDFKNYIPIPSFGNLIEIAALAKPDIIFMPSIGMEIHNPLLANIRLAPIQIVGLGNPATPMSDYIDYVVGPKSIYDERAFPKDIYIADGYPGTYAPLISREKFLAPVGKDISKPDVFNGKQGIRICVVGSDIKISYPFFKLLKEIVTESPFPIQVCFMMGVAGIDSFYIEKFLKENFENSVYYGWQPYENYIRAIKEIDVVLNPFPFGHTNTIVDTLMCGKPCMGLEGVEPASKSESDVLDTVGLKSMFIAQTEDEYKSKFFAIAEKILNGQTEFFDRNEIYDRLFIEPEGYDYGKVMSWIYDNHSKMKSSNKKYFEVFQDMEI